MSIVSKPMRSGEPLPDQAWAFRLLGDHNTGTLSCGFMRKGRGHDPGDGVRPSFSAVLCLAGQALYNQRWTINAGDVFFRFTGIAHDVEIMSAPWHECWISVGEPLERLLIDTGYLQPEQPVRTVGLRSPWLNTLAASIVPLERASPGELVHQLTHFIGLLTELLTPTAPSSFALDLACRELGQPEPTLRDIAAHLGLRYDEFRRAFRNATGLAPGTWRQQRLMERARLALLATTRSVTDIAEELGYANPFAFSAAFRRASGVSPRAWRQGRL